MSQEIEHPLTAINHVFSTQPDTELLFNPFPNGTGEGTQQEEMLHTLSPVAEETAIVGWNVTPHQLETRR